MNALLSRQRKKTTLLNRSFTLPLCLLQTFLMMAALILCALFFHIPNPNMILIAGLVVCSALFGYPGGLLGGAMMLGYTLYFFSTDNSFVSFTPLNAQKVLVSMIGIVVVAAFVCELKRSEMKAFREIADLTEQLSSENKELHALSSKDALTGIGNRHALRNDFPAFLNNTVYLLMLDLDNFKQINDTYGHNTGDLCLVKTAELLSELFGAEHAYRYGGDEFIAIVPDDGTRSFLRLVRTLRNRENVLDLGNKAVRFTYSVGYTHGYAAEPDDLRELMSVADEKMYHVKRAGKPHKARQRAS